MAVNRVNVGEERPWVTPIEPFDLKLSGPIREDEKATSHVVECALDSFQGDKYGLYEIILGSATR